MQSSLATARQPRGHQRVSGALMLSRARRTSRFAARALGTAAAIASARLP